MHEFLFSHDVRHDRAAVQPALGMFALGLWIRLGFVGTSAFVAALVALLDAGTDVGAALAVALGGGALAAVAWSRIRSALRQDTTQTSIAQRAPINS
jgi:hypothetical protein